MLVDSVHQASSGPSDGRSEPQNRDHVTVPRRPHLACEKSTSAHASGFTPDTVGAQGRYQRLRKRRHRDRFLRRHIDMLTQAGAQAFMVRNQGGCRRIRTGMKKCLGNREAKRSTIGVALEEKRAASRNYGQIGFWEPRFRTVLPKGSDRYVDKRRVERREIGISEAPSCKRSWTKGFDQKIRIGSQCLQLLAIGFTLEIESYASLVSVECPKPE